MRTGFPVQPETGDCLIYSHYPRVGPAFQTCNKTGLVSEIGHLLNFNDRIKDSKSYVIFVLCNSESCWSDIFHGFPFTSELMPLCSQI